MKRTVVSAALAVPLAMANSAAAVAESDHAHVARTGSLHVDAPPHLALGLFTGPGERLWIEEWEPVVLSGDGLEKGSVFVTDVHEPTIWIVIEFDRDALHAQYARVTPGSRAGTVDVKVVSDGAGGSIAHVSYELTGLSEAGNEILAAFDETSYAEMLKSWEQMIQDADIDYESAFFAGLE